MDCDTNPRSVDFLGAPFDLQPVDDVLKRLAACVEGVPFQYVVTPNVDHVVRLSRSPQLLICYREAWMSWCDSNPIRISARCFNIPIPHLNGTDVMERLFREALIEGDRIAVIVADRQMVDDLRRCFPKLVISGYSPPPRMVEKPGGIQSCVDFLIQNPARFAFIAVGSPGSEMVANRVLHTAGGVGTAFCIGAALEFITGRKARAPRLLQTIGLEWLHRVLSEPRRLWRRYTFAFIPFLSLLAKEVSKRALRRQSPV
jgi:N-acetylglucosaminyldiphosphoundecaprenol N-acetyl-beta-D-mannosaminyltransferase